MKKEKTEKKQKLKNAPSAEKVRRFPRFGILDAVIILLIISVIVGIAFRYNVFKTFTDLKDLDEFAVSFSVKNIESTTQHEIEIGDGVYFKDSGESFGAIMKSSDVSSEALNTSPSTQTFIENGSAITVAYPINTRIDAAGRIKCEGKLSSDGTFLLNGSDYLSAGQTYIVCTEKVTLEITILGIELIENAEK